METRTRSLPILNKRSQITFHSGTCRIWIRRSKLKITKRTHTKNGRQDHYFLLLELVTKWYGFVMYESIPKTYVCASMCIRSTLLDTICQVRIRSRAYTFKHGHFLCRHDTAHFLLPENTHDMPGASAFYARLMCSEGTCWTHIVLWGLQILVPLLNECQSKKGCVPIEVNDWCMLVNLYISFLCFLPKEKSRSK